MEDNLSSYQTSTARGIIGIEHSGGSTRTMAVLEKAKEEEKENNFQVAALSSLVIKHDVLARRRRKWKN